MKNIQHLHSIWSEFNTEHFDGLLEPIPILLKYMRSKDGFYSYRAHKDGKPIRQELHRACIVISDAWFFDEDPWGGIYGTLLHEMIHQYQAEVLNCDCEHDARFNGYAELLEEKTGYPIL